jgi:2-methylcitrate dehydratase
VLLKLYPAEFHAQTAVEAAVQLSPAVRARVDQVRRVTIETQESAVRIISKTGPLRNPADRDHCLQYITAVALLYGTVTPAHYQDDVAADPRVDALRTRMVVREDPAFSAAYLDPERRAVANRVAVEWDDGTVLGPVTVEYPLGHPRRRHEAEARVWAKCEENLASRFVPARVERLLALLRDPDLPDIPVPDFTEAWAL